MISFFYDKILKITYLYFIKVTFVNSSFLALDIVEIGLIGKTGKRIIYTRNGIILRVW